MGMKGLRRWKLDATKPFSFQLAADARLSQTDYTDDQVWELRLGAVESPALALQTQYGGRVGLASLVPMWSHDGRAIYQTQTYAEPPLITAFAPDYLQAQAKLTPTIKLQAEYWVMESHAIGGCFTLANTGQQTEKLRLDLFGHVVAKTKEQALAIVALKKKRTALAMGEIGTIRPVVMMENGDAAAGVGEAASPKIGVDLTLPVKSRVTVRWIHAGDGDLRDSLARAQHWLQQDWTPYFQRIEQAAQSVPIIKTGKSDWDAMIASSYQQLVQSILKPTASLPYASFVATRQSWQGFSRRGDGSDHPRAWSGQTPTLAYLVASAVASIDPAIAQGIIRNYLAIQADDGWVDYQPGLAGQRQDIMCLPILARLTWNIYQSTEDQDFLADVFPALLKFFERWFASDLDTDEDGLPEWQSERQTGYVFTPTFAVSSNWAQNADIRLLETPDMAAYLLSEARILREIAQLLGKKRPVNQLEKRISALQALLDELWQDGRYAYRDRDSHTSTGSIVIIDKGRGDEEHLPAMPLDPANRVIVRVFGGGSNTPRGSLYLEGLDQNGQVIKETPDSKAFVWSYGRGVYTSQNVFAQLDRVRFDGLSRVYDLHVQTVDSTQSDINGLLPLWSGGIPQDRAAGLVQLLTEKQQFWRANGVTMNPAQDVNFDPANADGSGGVWPFWLTLIGEGLIHYGYAEQVADLLKNLLNAQTSVLTEQKKFFEFYHSDEAQGCGERGHVAGIVPLHLLMQAFGVRILSSGQVNVNKTFAWKRRVRITQHGVTVERSDEGIQIKFPSGYTVDLEAKPGWQAVVDPNPAAPVSIKPLPAAPPPTTKSPRKSPKSVIIDVQIESDDDA
jgi:hypothetical protein